MNTGNRNIATPAVHMNAVVESQKFWYGSPSGPPTIASRDYSRNSFFNRPNKVVNEANELGYRKPSSYYGYTTGHHIELPFSTHEYIDGSLSRSGYKMKVHGSMLGSIGHDHTLIQELQKAHRDHLRMKILTNVKDEVLDIAMVLAEAKSTVNLLQKGLGVVARSLDAVRTRNPRHFRYLMHGEFSADGRRPTDRFLRESASVFLEWKYGIMPTIYDVEGYTKALDINEEGSLFDNPALMVARAHLQGEVSHATPLLIHGPRVNSSQTDECTIKYNWTYAARADYNVSAEGIRGLSRYGIGLGTVGTVLLERTPFMFVLNMAFPIIDLVKAWTALAGVDQFGYTETMYVAPTLKKGGTVYKFDSAPSSWIPVNWDDTKLMASFTRTASSTIPMPMPFVRNPINTGNFSTVLALFTSLRKREPLAPKPPVKRKRNPPRNSYLPPLEYTK